MDKIATCYDAKSHFELPGLGLLIAVGAEENTHYERECPCTPSKLWLDVVFAIDNSLGMTMEGMVQAEELFAEGRPAGVRENVKQAIIIYANVYKLYFGDAKQLADQIKISGKDIIVVAFDQGGRPVLFWNFARKQWLQYSLDSVKYGSCLKIGGIDSN
ncbi:unnamed protein product [Cylicocyclus nassatus]|uniref:Uncharacterized protein n=1 Tax=Cylicocyclus nassatus TaxID=53992 RepID=A0AA36H663_CYLNA|nr:unnamed protein product [Cylicocyclus nassatus]